MFVALSPARSYPQTMNRIYAALLAASLLPVTVGAAEIYRTVDENGNVVYTDRPVQGGKQVELPELSTYEALPAPPAAPAQPNTAAATEDNPAVKLSFVQPTEGETVFNNQGNLIVAVRVEPPLEPAQKLAVQIDDAEPVRIQEPTHQFTEVHRGTHTVKAWVENAVGEPVGQQAAVTFYMRQASRLLRNPGAQSGPIQQAPQAPRAPTAPNFPASAQ